MATHEWIPADCVAAFAGQGRCAAARQKVIRLLLLAGSLWPVLTCGCKATPVKLGQVSLIDQVAQADAQRLSDNEVPLLSPESASGSTSSESVIEQVSGTEGDQLTPLEVPEIPIPVLGTGLPEPTPVGPTEPIQLEQVIDAIYQAYPLLRIAVAGRNVAAGDNINAQGEFDLKFKADTFNQPLGYYENYRQGVGFEQPLYGGGNVFGGYRIGQGNFEPWYGNRATNGGGEFLLGLSVPLWQDRKIDERRAQLWRTAYGQEIVEPEIQSQLLGFVRDGSVAYWEWVAAGQNFRFAEELLKLAQNRDQQLRTQVKEGDLAESFLTDNERLIVGRRVKRLATLQKLQTAAVKLSLYLRLPGGMPFVPGPDLLPATFPEALPVNRETLNQDISFAQARRPELASLDIARRQLDVDLQQAINQFQPALDARLYNSKDVGYEASLGEKSPYLLEAGLQFSVPLQRRKARGKITAIEGKIAQWLAKRQYASDKISVEVQTAVIALDMAYQAIDEAREAVRLNEEMERYETIRLEQGDSDFLRLNLRETATFDARVVEVEAMLRYFEAQSDYRAAIAVDLSAPVETGP